MQFDSLYIPTFGLLIKNVPNSMTLCFAVNFILLLHSLIPSVFSVALQDVSCIYSMALS